MFMPVLQAKLVTQVLHTISASYVTSTLMKITVGTKHTSLSAIAISVLALLTLVVSMTQVKMVHTSHLGMTMIYQ